MQAQTLANFFLAFERDLTIIPVINKIDMDAADVPKVLSELKTALDIEPSEVSLTFDSNHYTCGSSVTSSYLLMLSTIVINCCLRDVIFHLITTRARSTEDSLQVW
jgi:hypothetical protein